MSRIAHAVKEKARTGDVLISENIDFSSLLLSDLVSKGLKNSGFIKPSPIQLKAIPLGRCGLDLIVQAKSGTGKTCVFSVIALDSIKMDSPTIQVLVLAPTREIAVQIWEVIGSIGSAIPGLQCHTFIGGLPLHEDRMKLKLCHIAVGTPGRVKQLIEGGLLKTDSIRLFVLDEADKLLEEGFQQQINWIYSSLPENKQMLALSATYPEYLADHLTAYMRNPTFLRLNITDPTLLGIRQYARTVAAHPMSHVVFEEKCKVLTTILGSISFQQCLVFSNMQTRAQNLAESLTNKGWPTACIAGCLDQKERNYAMSKLKTYKCRILISTDLTSRGIDADKVNLIVNMDIPKDHETYLHRIGRAGRYGSFGIAITLVSEGQENQSVVSVSLCHDVCHLLAGSFGIAITLVSEGQEQRLLDTIEKRCHTHIHPLPDPIPSDLAKAESPVYLDDVVSSEVIHTDGHHSPVKSKLSKHNGDNAANLSGINGTRSPNRETIRNAATNLKPELNSDSANNAAVVDKQSSCESNHRDNEVMNGGDAFDNLLMEGNDMIIKQRNSLKEGNNIPETVYSVSKDEEMNLTQYNDLLSKSQYGPDTDISISNYLTSETLLDNDNALSNVPNMLSRVCGEKKSETTISKTLCFDKFESHNDTNKKGEILTETSDTELKTEASDHVIINKEINTVNVDHGSTMTSKMTSKPLTSTTAMKKSNVLHARVVEKQSPKKLLKNTKKTIKEPKPLDVPLVRGPGSVDLSSIFKQSIGFKHVENSHNYFTAKQSFDEFVKKEDHKNDSVHTVQESDSSPENMSHSKLAFKPTFPKCQSDSGHTDELKQMVSDLQEMFDKNILPRSDSHHLENDVGSEDESEDNIEPEPIELSELTEVDISEEPADILCDELTVESEHASVSHKEPLTDDGTVRVASSSSIPEPDGTDDAGAKSQSKQKPRQKRGRPGYKGHFAIAHMLQNMDLTAYGSPDSAQTEGQEKTTIDLQCSQSLENNDIHLPQKSNDMAVNNIDVEISSNTNLFLDKSPNIAVKPKSESMYAVSQEKQPFYMEQTDEQVDSNVHNTINNGRQATVQNSYLSGKLKDKNYNSQSAVPRYTRKTSDAKNGNGPSSEDSDSDSESESDGVSSLSESSYEADTPAPSSKYNRGGNVESGKYADSGCRPKTKNRSVRESEYDISPEWDYKQEMGYPSYYGNHEDSYFPTDQKGREHNSKQRKHATLPEMSYFDQATPYALWYQQNNGNHYQNQFPWQQYPGNTSQQYPGNPSQQFPWLQNNGMYTGYSPWGGVPGYSNPPVQFGGPFPGNMYNPWNPCPQPHPGDLETSMRRAYDLQHQYIQAMSSSSSNTDRRKSRKSKKKL